MIRFTLLALTALSLASCGGGGGSSADDYQTALDQADAARAQAISLAPASPCNAVQQCGALVLVQPQGHCSATSYTPYSLVSSTADAASAAAANERVLAARAVSLAPPPATACPAVVVAPPTLGCVVNACQAMTPVN